MLQPIKNLILKTMLYNVLKWKFVYFHIKIIFK